MISSPNYVARNEPIPTIELSRRAAKEIVRARQWWLDNRDKAPEAFDEELEALLEKLESKPQSLGTGQRNHDRRRLLIKRIRYYVYFRIVNDGELVEVLAFWHASRGQEPKLR